MKKNFTKTILTTGLCFLIIFNSSAKMIEIDSILLKVNQFHEDNTQELNFENFSSNDDFDFFKKRKFKKKKSRKPSLSSTVRLKCQSKGVHKTIKNTNKRNTFHKKQIKKNQANQRRYCSKKNHLKQKKSRFDRRSKIKKIRRY